MSLPRRNDNYEWMLRDWYGFERAESEIAAKLSAPKAVADALDDAVKHIISPVRMNIIKVQNEWRKIVGDVNAKHTVPSFLKDGILYVEISHPAYRMALDTPKMKTLFLERIQKEFGADFCSKILFVPAGRRA